MYRYKNKIYLLQNKIWWIFIFSFSEDSFWFVSKSLFETEKWKSVYLVIGATLKLFFTKKYLSYPKKKLLIFFLFLILEERKRENVWKIFCHFWNEKIVLRQKILHFNSRYREQNFSIRLCRLSAQKTFFFSIFLPPHDVLD